MKFGEWFNRNFSTMIFLTKPILTKGFMWDIHTFSVNRGPSTIYGYHLEEFKSLDFIPLGFSYPETNIPARDPKQCKKKMKRSEINSRHKLVKH